MASSAISTVTGLPQEDTGGRGLDPAEYGRGRLTFVADTWKSHLDPAKHLGPGRHGEWTETSSGLGPKAGPAWGVAYLTPGMDAHDPRAAILRKQQQR